MNPIGRTAEVRLRVPIARTQEDFPAVLANSRIVEIMESAAVKLVKPWLQDGESTLTVKLDVTFLRPSSHQGMVRSVATYTGGSGRLHHFTIHAFDETGLIASCEHTRAVVSPRRLVAGARRRVGEPAMLLNA